MTFAIRHEAEQDGISREFIVYEVEPIGFTDFCEHLTTGRNTFHVNARARVHAAPDLPVGTKMKIGHTVVFHRAVKYYALVPGGVLPPDHLLRGGTRLLMDRNVVSDLRGMPAVDNESPHPLRWLDSDGFHVNPILGVLEGRKQRPLCRNEFRIEYLQARQDIRQRLPRANMVDFTGTGWQNMYSMHRHFVPRLKREQKFMLAIADRLANPVAKRDLVATERFILATAAGCGLRPLTLVVLTVLAKLYEGTDHRPAGRLLKLSELLDAGKGWRRCAYNALADIRQMEMLSGGRTMPDYVAALTGDVALAQVWCGLRPTGVQGDDGKIHFSFHLDPALFTRLQGTTDELLERARASSAPDMGSGRKPTKHMRLS